MTTSDWKADVVGSSKPKVPLYHFDVIILINFQVNGITVPEQLNIFTHLDRI